MSDDPVIAQLREQIATTDLTILDAVNTRLRLVEEIKAYKESKGIPFLDRDREREMLDYLTRANRGPLSTSGLRELFAAILSLSKREVSGESA
jgi:chorismate mutase